MCKFETADNEYPLTSYQKDVWLEQIFYPQQPVYNVGGYYHIKGELSHEILEEALNKVINNNKALRIQIVEKEGKPYQKILPKIDYKLPYKDFSDKENPYDYALKWAQEKFVKIFSFDSFLFDFTLIKLGTDNHLLYLKGHHLIGDGWGFSLMYTRIVKIYNQLINNNLQSDQTEDHYIDYIQANLDYLNSKRYEKDLEFWKDKFQQLPEPLFTNKNKINDLAAEEKTLVVERDFYDKLIDLCANNNVSMFHFMLGILALYFSKVCRRQEIVIGVPILNRRKKYKKTIGHFANVIPLKVELKNDLTFIELAQNIKRELRRCYRHIKSSSSDIYRILSKDNTSQRNLYDICLSYENLDYNYHFANTHTEKVTLSAKCEDTPFALFIREFTDDEDVKIDFHYQLNVFEDFIPIENLIQHFEYLLTTLVTNGHQKIDKIEIIPPQEKEKILHQFNDRRTNDPLNKTLPELFVEQVEKTPDKTAIITVDKKLTYKELNERANQIARVLRTKGVTQKTVVGLMLENSVEMIVGTLATLKAGGAYLPLSCGYSTKQKKYILEDSEVEIILVSKEVDNQEIFTEEIINLANQDLYQKKKTNLARQMPPTNLAYLNYIFDSTEQQKGVMIEQRGIVNLIKFFINEFNLTAADNVLKFAAIDNDISIAEIFLTLLSGASLYIAPETVKDDYAEVIEYLNKNNITVAALPPTYAINLNSENIETLRILTTAELTTNINLINKWKDKVEFINTYGPPENTVWTTYWRANSRTDTDREIPLIGEPIANNEVYIVDKDNNLQPIGVKGELCIAGVSLARGYLNKSELTAEKFIDNPFGTGKMYKTGDLARWLPNGKLQFLGRTTNQVQIEGYTVQLEKVENKLLTYQHVEQATVIAKEEGADKHLIAYVIANQKLATSKLRDYLSEQVLDYMVPADFIQLKQDAVSQIQEDQDDNDSMEVEFDI